MGNLAINASSRATRHKEDKIMYGWYNEMGSPCIPPHQQQKQKQTMQQPVWGVSTNPSHHDHRQAELILYECHFSTTTQLSHQQTVALKLKQKSGLADFRLSFQRLFLQFVG